MTYLNIKKRFPAKTVILSILVAIMAIIIIGLVFPGVGAWLLGSVMWMLASIMGFFLPALPQLLVWTTIVFVFIGLYIYRKNYSKKKVLVPTGSNLPARDTLSSGIFDEDVEVSS